MALKARPSLGQFLKPEELSGMTLIIDVIRFERQRPGVKYGPKDTAHVNITAYDKAGLASGTPTKELLGTMVQQTALARDLEPLVGDTTIVKLDKAAAKPGQNAAWIMVDPAPEDYDRAVELYEAREAQLAAALDDMPDWMK